MKDAYSLYFPKGAAKKLAEYMNIERDQKLLPFRIRLLAFIAACQSLGRLKILRGLLKLALESGIDSKEIYEILLQGYLFVGYPKAIESFFVFNEVLSEAKESRITSGSEIEPLNYNLFEARGLTAAKRIYGKNFDLVHDNIKNLCPDLASGMVIEGYGRIISRPGLDILARELAVVAVLTVGSMPRQLYSHIKGSLNIGANPGQVEAIIEQCGFFINPSKKSQALSILEKVLGNNADPR